MRIELERSLERGARPGEIARLVQRVAQIVAGARVLRLKLERALEVRRGIRDESPPPEQPAQLEVSRRVGRIQPQHAAEIPVRFVVQPKMGVDPTAEHQELRLIRLMAERVAHDPERLLALVEQHQQSGEVQSSVGVRGLRRQQLAVNRHRVGGTRAGRERVGVLEQPLARSGNACGRAGGLGRRLAHRLGRRHAAARLVGGWGHEGW